MVIRSERKWKKPEMARLIRKGPAITIPAAAPAAAPPRPTDGHACALPAREQVPAHAVSLLNDWHVNCFMSRRLNLHGSADDMSILDPRFKYTPAISTDIASTWKKFGFKPTTEAERIARERKRAAMYGDDRRPQRFVQVIDSERTTRPHGFGLRICEGASRAH
jgi:hypothetical protein